MRLGELQDRATTVPAPPDDSGDSILNLLMQVADALGQVAFILRWDATSRRPRSRQEWWLFIATDLLIEIGMVFRHVGRGRGSHALASAHRALRVMENLGAAIVDRTPAQRLLPPPAPELVDPEAAEAADRIAQDVVGRLFVLVAALAGALGVDLDRAARRYLEGVDR